MPYRVKVSNYQSIRKAEITVSGLTAITGPNNSGKTALIRAITGVFTNTPGTAFVRHGAEFTEVEIEFLGEDGGSIRWKKGPKVKPEYSINGGPGLNPGRGVPDEIAGFMVVPIQAGGSDIWPQLAQQFSGQLFLLDKSGAVVAEAVADVERVGRLTRALKLSESDKRSARSSLKVRRQDEISLEASLQVFDGLPDVEAAVQQVLALRESMKQTAADVREFRDLSQRHREATETIETLLPAEDIQLPPPAVVQAARVDGNKLRVVADLQRRIRRSAMVIDALEGADAVVVPGPGDAQATKKELGEWGRLQKRWIAARQGVQDAEEAAAATQAHPVDPDAVGAAQRVSKAMGMFSGFRSQMASGQQRIQGLEAELTQKDADLEQAEQEVQALLQEVGACPTCGSDTHTVHP